MEERNEEAYSHVLKYTGIFGGVQGLVMLISLIRNKAMAMFLGASGLGLSSLLLSAQNFASQCTNLGISFGAVPRLSDYYEQNDTEHLQYYIQVIRLWSLIAAGLGFVFCLAISPLLNAYSFTWGNHTYHYAMMAVTVAMTAIVGGETAILKATRKLNSLARIQVYTALLSIFISVPLYYYLFHTGIVPAIVLTAFATLISTVIYSYRYYPLHLNYEKSMFTEGAGMIKLGVAFILAAALGSASEMLIRSYLNVDGYLDDVGFYNAVYMITITYAGMVFTAMESDYFPRLSAVAHDVQMANETVNRQMEVSLLLLAPMLTGLMMVLPVLIPMLFTTEFLPIVEVAQVALLAMYFKVLTLPVAYLTLARRASATFLVLEFSYLAVFVFCVMTGYHYFGLYGTGVAIVFAHVFDYLMINIYAYKVFGYRSTRTIYHYATLQLAIGFAAYVVSLLSYGWLYWVAEAALTIVSMAFSLLILHQKTHLWESLKKKAGL